jgi:hypothetical protein
MLCGVEQFSASHGGRNCAWTRDAKRFIVSSMEAFDRYDRAVTLAESVAELVTRPEPDWPSICSQAKALIAIADELSGSPAGPRTRRASKDDALDPWARNARRHATS